MATPISQLKSTAAVLATKTLAAGLLVWNETAKRWHGGDGVTVGGIPMAREDQKNDGSFAYLEAVKINDYAIVAADKGICLIANKATSITFTLAAAATLGANFNCAIKNIGAGTLTIAATGAETIDGAASLSIASGGAIMLRGNGNSFRSFFATGLNKTGDTMTGPLDMSGNPISKISSVNGAGVGGFRNLLLNGGATFIVRGSKTIAAGASGYVFDRFLVTNTTNQAVTVSQPTMTPGQVQVPGNPRHRMRFAFATAPTSGALRVEQRIEDCFKLAGLKASSRVYATGPVGNEALACEVVQNFGAGGAPSTAVTTAAASLDIATIYDAATQRRRAQFVIPPIASKVLGASGDYLALAWTLTPRQAGNYELTRFSLVEGDAFWEDDPFAPIDKSLEKVECERFCNYYEGNIYSFAGSGTTNVRRINLHWSTTMRAVPNVTWQSGDVFGLDERTASYARWFTDPGNNTFDGRSINAVLADAEL